MNLLWSRVCLVVNVIGIIISLCGVGTMIGFILTEFHDLPESDIWMASQCYISAAKQIDHQTFFQVSSNLTQQSGLCAIDRLIHQTKNHSNNSLVLELESEMSVECYIPPDPLLFEQCSLDSPIQKLTLLAEEAKTIRAQLRQHIIFYRLAWASGILGFICFVWCCYSYWFYFCACRESNYWCCGGDKDNYQILWDNFNFSQPDDLADLRFNIRDD